MTDDTPAEPSFRFRRGYVFAGGALYAALTAAIIWKLTDADALKWIGIGLIAANVIREGFYMAGASLADWALVTKAWEGAPMMDGTFFGRLSQGRLGPREAEGYDAILAATEGWDARWRAYALATAYHETGRTMAPVHEVGRPGYFLRRYDPAGDNPRLAAELGNTEPGDGIRYAGRGFVQLTGRGAYRPLGARLSLPLEDDPDLALKAPVAARVLATGMAEGLFTGKRLADYFTGSLTNPVGARRVVNGLDRAGPIAGYYDQFLEALR